MVDHLGMYQPEIDLLGALSVFGCHLVQTLTVTYDLKMKRFWTAPLRSKRRRVVFTSWGIKKQGHR
jgi:hypothetical protein